MCATANATAEHEPRALFFCVLIASSNRENFSPFSNSPDATVLRRITIKRLSMVREMSASRQHHSPFTRSRYVSSPKAIEKTAPGSVATK
mmetsp:Transcript_91807/g.182967  ORF Transcript_91807/g.182967 Transcript_91807/m.182967 type:complete len:90 (+) Transcript_91807:328-597(+)